jgi:hypothetical protein
MDARTHLETNLQRAGVREQITLIDGDADKVIWPSVVDFAYIDGWHSYLAAKFDFEQCAKRGAECICFDDAVQSVGPRMLVHEIRASGEWDVIDVLRDCGMAICMRKVKKSPITFSQELPPPNTGVDLQTLTKAGQGDHLSAASRLNGVDYSSINHLLCDGRKE